MKSVYFTWAHNIEGCLRNGSFVAQRTKNRLVQYMNGDYMGTLEAVPKGMIEVDAALAKRLLPNCCK